MNPRVLLDANIWYKHPLLRTNIAQALLFRLNGNPQSIVLPRVVEDEVRKNALEYATEHRAKVVEGLGRLALVLGADHLPQPASVKELSASIEQRFHELSSMFHRVPMTLGHASAALRRVMDGRAPSKPKQQFKDCVIWETALDEADRAPLHFVTDDGAFFEERKTEKGMAADLLDDCKKTKYEIKLHRSIESLLEALQQQSPVLDLSAFEAAVLPEVHKVLSAHVAQHSLVYGRLLDRSFRAFSTIEPDELAVSFTFIFDAHEQAFDDEQSDVNDKIRLTGSARYNVQTGTIRHVMLDVLTYLVLGTTPVPGRGASYMYANGWKPSQIVAPLENAYGSPYKSVV